MGRRKKKQRFNFPSPEQEAPLTDEQLDAEIDGASTVSEMADSVEKQKKNNEEKRKVAESIKEIPLVFTPEQVEWVFDAYVLAISFVFSIVLKTPFQPIHEELKLDDDIKKSWSKPLAKICSKYCPVEWAGMTDEIQLCVSIGLYSVSSFRRAQMVSKKEQEKKNHERTQHRNANPANANMSREGTGTVQTAAD